MPNIDDIRNEDLREGREIDKEIEREDKKEEREKSALEGIIREADLKEDSRDVIIAKQIVCDIEKDPVKTNEFKDAQQAYATEIFSEKSADRDLNGDVIHARDSIDFVMREIENESALRVYKDIVSENGTPYEQNIANILIGEILDKDTTCSAWETSAACSVVLDMHDSGRLADMRLSTEEEKERIVNTIIQEGRDTYADRLKAPTVEKETQRTESEREILIREYTDKFAREINPDGSNDKMEYHAAQIFEKIEMNPYASDSFKDQQIRFAEAHLKDDTVKDKFSENPQDAERYVYSQSLNEVMRMEINEARNNGSASFDVISHVKNHFSFDMSKDVRDSQVASVCESLRNGEFKDVRLEDRFSNTDKDIRDEKNNQILADTLKKVEERAKEMVDSRQADEREKEERVKEIENNIKSAATEIEKSGFKDSDSLRANIESSIKESLYDKNIYPDDMKKEILDKVVFNLSQDERKDKDFSVSDFQRALSMAEKDVILEKITDGKDSLTVSQERASSYVEKLMVREDLNHAEKSANGMSVLTAYKEERIPEKEDLSKRAERSVIHNIEMDAKDRLETAKIDKQDNVRYLKEIKITDDSRNADINKSKDSAKFTFHIIDRNMAMDSDMKDKTKEILVSRINEELNQDKRVDESKCREMLIDIERKAYVDKLTGGTGSINEKSVQRAVDMIDRIKDIPMRAEERTAAFKSVVSMHERGEIPKDGKFGDDKKRDAINNAINEGRQELDKIRSNVKARDELILKQVGIERTKDEARAEDKKPEASVEKDKPDNKQERDADKKEKPQREIGVDPEKDAKEEAKNSKQVWYQEAKEVWEKSAEIYERKVLSANHHTDTTLSQSERDIVERSIKLRQEQIDKNNAEKAALVEKSVKLQRQSQEVPKDIIERLGKLEKYNQASEREIYKMKQMVDPEYIRARELSRPFGESREHMKKALEEKTIYPDPSDKRLFHFKQEALHWKNHKGIMERVTYEACLYSCLTGRKPSSVAGKDITTFDVRNTSLPAVCFSRAMSECIHSEGARMYLEIFKIDGRKAKPLEINNVCDVIDRINKSNADERTKSLQRVAIADMCRDGKIGNVKQNDTYRNNLYEKAVAIARERRMVKDPIKEGIEREEKKDSLREKLAKVPEKTDREIVKYILETKEKVDLQALQEISRDAKETLRQQAPVDKDGNKQPVPMEFYQLSKQELRKIICGPNPEALSQLLINVRLPEGAEINREMYDRAIEVIRGTNEKNDVVKMAMVNFALSKDGSFKSLDGIEGQRLDAIERHSTMLVKSLADMSAKHELVKVIRNDLKAVVKEERKEQREQSRKELRPINYDRSPEMILRDTSRYIGNLCRSEDYSRDKMEAKLLEVRDGMKYHRSTFYEDFKSIRTKDRGLKPNDAIAVAARDPRMFLGIQRAGISIGMNGLINEARLNDTIMKMEMVPRDNVVLRMAILEKNFVSHKNNSMDLKNAINFGNREDTKDANNMALWLYARDNNLKFREPSNEREREALENNIAVFRDCEARERVEKTFVTNLSDLYSDKALEKSTTFTNLAKDLSPVAALAVRPDYEEKLAYFINGLKMRQDSSEKNVQESIKILETLSRMTDKERADSCVNGSVLNRSYDSNGNAVDINLEARMVAIRAVERICGIDNNIMDKASVSRLNNHNVSSKYEELRSAVDEKAKRIYFCFKETLPTPAQADVVRSYISNNGYDAKLRINDRPDDVIDKKAEFLVDMGYGREISAGKDENGTSYLYSDKNLDKINSLYREVISKVDSIRDNYRQDGKLSVEMQREHIIASKALQLTEERAYRTYQYVRDEAVVGKDKLPSLMIDVQKRDPQHVREEGLKNMPMYNGSTNLVSVGPDKYEDKMTFLKIPEIYDYPIDKVRPSVELHAFAINASDLKTIMDNREHIVDCGIHYEIDFSNGYDAPLFSASGLNDISVSNLSEDVYKALVRSCSADDFKTVTEMRHDDDIYRMAKDGATAYQKYHADFSRDVAKRPEYFDRHVNELYNYMDILRDSRKAVMNCGNHYSDIEDKVSAYAAIEYSRQQIFEMAPEDVLNEAYRMWQEDNQTSSITAEHAAKIHFDTITYVEEPEIIDEKTPSEVAMELSERIGYAFDDAIAFMDAYDNGLMTQEEFERASITYNLFQDIEEQEYLMEHANDRDVPEEEMLASMTPEVREEYLRQKELEKQQEEQGYNEEYPQNDGYDDYRSDYQIPIEDDSVLAYTDREANTPFANLFNGIDFGFEREEVPVMCEDELSDFGPQNIYDSGAAYYEEETVDYSNYEMTEEEYEYYQEIDSMN